MPAWVYVLAVSGVASVLFVWTFHPFRKGAHAVPRGESVTPDVRDLTLPRAPVAGRPPWMAGFYDDQHPPPATYDRTYLAAAPVWAAPESDRVTLYGGASGSLGSDYGGRWGPADGQWLDDGTHRIMGAVGSRLATDTDTALAADVADYMRRQNTETGLFLAYLIDDCRSYVRALAVAL